MGWWIPRFSLFAGVHGFKGPADAGRNGNFGFHEGINFGVPLLGDPFGVGVQAGFRAAHSNFSGDQTVAMRDTSRDQLFFTVGFFRRMPQRGLQGGVVFDVLNDRYLGTVRLSQIRTESALVFGGMREIGFSSAYGTDRDIFALLDGGTLMEPTDTYAIFYRRRFSGGGNGRVWTGISGSGDALVGADATVPLGTSWALQNNFIYLLPKEGDGSGGQQEETWSVSIQLTWYPGRVAARTLRDRFHPLFGVADNSHFLLDRR